jgi:hypothetical protein
MSNTKTLLFWTVIWVLSMALMTFGPQYLWDNNVAFQLGATSLNIVLGIAMIWANKKHLLGLDELQQRIHLEAMGVSMGLGLVLGLAWESLARQDFLDTKAQISHLVMLMAITYIISIVIGVRRYQ